MLPQENGDLAAIFFEMADLLEIQGSNPFRIRAFRRVGQALEHLPEQASTMLERGTLAKVPGIGEGSLQRIKEILETGSCHDHRALRQALPAGLLEMMNIEGLGPKKISLFYSTLGITSVDALEKAAQEGHLAALPRMGEKSQAKLLQAIAAYRRHSGRILLGDALPQGLAILAVLKQVPDVVRGDLAGSVRRGRETIGDLDVLVAAASSAAVMDCFTQLDLVQEVMLRGDTKCSVRLKSGLQVDLRVVAPASFGAALHYFTGSKMHNIAIRDRAKRQGLRVNEYGVYDETSGKAVGGQREEEVFAAVGLSFIPPELREDRGEIEAAEAGTLPTLVQETDLRGDLHLHTKDSDGSGTAQEMAEAASRLGYEYLAITDHSQSLTVAHGLDEKRLRQQMKMLRQQADQWGDLHLLCGIEVDILADGTLDLPLSLLRQLDWVVASVHSHFNQPAEQMTQRVLRAMESGVVDCIGHPSGRLLGQRDGYAVDLDLLIRRAAHLGVAMELNAFPDRLDLDAQHCRQAKENNVLVVINTDAHSPRHLTQRAFGLATARRGWLEPSDVLNAQPLSVIQERRQSRLYRVLGKS